ncbi:unnamed protein product [Kuraishia capsulata CBS 1993]|uniref:Peroxisomal membrane protein PEX13 n=1 Tax=Kuraishia capsulata CBS 1993 TaxID=1382522 RepID=W6MGS8_9ASCO|nr:uncharacterized protein KUCA_T00001023001 [Kuraishia capsulata CBS 1993]CDK25056.1 unnamed protein product [Kuraishia capsulata CBS 1993]
MSQPRAKPWEVSSGTSMASTTPATSATVSESGAPAIPSKPSSMTSSSLNTASAASTGLASNPNTFGNMMSNSYTSPYSSGYGSAGGYGAYSGYGGYGSSGYGGLGGFGSSSYGGYGGGMYGSRYGGGYGGMYGNNMMNMGNGNELGGLAQNSEATFQLIESMIGAVGGFAQMLESTYYATHNSFFTMISMAEQFSHLKNALGSLLGIFTLIKWAKKLLGRAVGIKKSLTPAEFAKFQKKQLKERDNSNNSNNNNNNRISLKPLVFFLAAIFGLPYLMNKLIRRLAQEQQNSVAHQLRPDQLQNGEPQQLPLQAQNQAQQVDPTRLEFARALYDFNPENNEVELALRRGDLVAILSRADPLTGEESKWWKCRSRDSRLGFVPYNYLEVIQRNKNGNAIQSITSNAPQETAASSKTAKIDADEFKNLKT